MALTFLLLFGAGLWAGVQNALAGGGSFVTLPALIFAGLDPRLANITSTVALFPGQVTTGYAGRSLVADAERLSFKAMAIITLIGGVAGAFLLLQTPSKVFAAMVPWLVLGATGLFAWSSFGPKPHAQSVPPPAWVSGLIQAVIAIYSGFFGGGSPECGPLNNRINQLQSQYSQLQGQAQSDGSAERRAQLASLIEANCQSLWLWSK